MDSCEEEEVGEPIWLEEDNDSDEEEEVNLMNSAKASQPLLWSHNISLNALKTTVHSTTRHLQSLDISGGD